MGIDLLLIHAVPHWCRCICATAPWLIPVEETLSHSNPSSTDGSRTLSRCSPTSGESHRTTTRTIMLHLVTGLAALLISACGGGDGGAKPSPADIADEALVAQGRQIFRFDTFGDESQWTDTLPALQAYAIGATHCGGDRQARRTSCSASQAHGESAGKRLADR
jgi:hypothetical protein